MANVVGGRKMMARQIVIYTQPGWAFCGRTKEFLSQKGVGFVQKDVMADEEAMAELEEIGILSTPVTVIDGEIVVGFDRRKLEELLAG
jgi:glutaredoxin 3